jgi:DNA-3-methyladenine glycosylase II
VRAIVGQQLSVVAARAIHGRLTDLFGGRPPSSQELLDQDPELLRSAVGLSRAKVTFLRSLAEHVLADDDVVAELTAVKGLGAWTVHMFLMFQLQRPDVLAVGDLGIRRAVERAYGLPDLPSADELTALAEPWRPHRSAACRLLWRSLDNTPQVSEPA